MWWPLQLQKHMQSCEKHANEENMISFTRILKVKSQKHDKNTETCHRNQAVRTGKTTTQVGNQTLYTGLKGVTMADVYMDGDL